MNTNKIIIKTERLILKPISLKFKKRIFKEFTRKITIHMFPQPTGDMKDTEEFIRKSIKKNEKGKNMQMILLNKNSRDFMGCVGLHKVNTKTPELGIWIKKSFHGKKYGLEAVKALKEWAEKNLNYDYLYYPVVKENIASRKIPEAIGGRLFPEFVSKNSEGKKMVEVEYRIYKNKKELKNLCKN